MVTYLLTVYNEHYLLCNVFESTGVVGVHFKLLVSSAAGIVKRHLWSVLVSNDTKQQLLPLGGLVV